MPERQHPLTIARNDANASSVEEKITFLFLFLDFKVIQWYLKAGAITRPPTTAQFSSKTGCDS